MTKRLERWTCNLKALNSSAALRLQPGCVLCRLKIKSSAKLVNNQLVCLLPVDILTNFVSFNYMFLSLFVGHNVNYWAHSNYCVTSIKNVLLSLLWSHHSIP